MKLANDEADIDACDMMRKRTAGVRIPRAREGERGAVAAVQRPVPVGGRLVPPGGPQLLALVSACSRSDRGRENVAETTRPVLYLTSCRSWFRDAQNFPEERLLGPSPTAGGASGTPAGGFGASKAKAAKPMKAKAKKRK